MDAQKTLGIPIRQYDVDHKCLIAEYPSMILAADAIECDYNVFRRNVRMKNGVYKGYYWET